MMEVLRQVQMRSRLLLMRVKLNRQAAKQLAKRVNKPRA